jgi:hypothetical protein
VPGRPPSAPHLSESFVNQFDDVGYGEGYEYQRQQQQQQQYQPPNTADDYDYGLAGGDSDEDEDEEEELEGSMPEPHSNTSKGGVYTTLKSNYDSKSATSQGGSSGYRGLGSMPSFEHPYRTLKQRSINPSIASSLDVGVGSDVESLDVKRIIGELYL